MKTAVLGASGYIGSHIWRAYRHAHPDCIGTSHRSQPELHLFDATRPDLTALHLRESGHRAAILSIAKPLIGYCETNPAVSRKVNVEATLDIIRQLAKANLQVIWFSSDYVFDGLSGGYADDAPTCPQTEYGKQKAEVESLLPGITENHLILRLSKTYGTRLGDKTLLDEMAKNLLTGQSVCAAADQYFSPTHIDDLVAAVQGLQSAGARGLFNVSNPEDWSRFQIAKALAQKLGREEQVRKIRLHDLESMRGRPLNTTLRGHRLQQQFPMPFTPLNISLERVVQQWRNQ